MSGNIFKRQRFAQLFKQHFIHHHQLFLLSTVAYMGVIIISLSIAQISNDLEPHNLDIFQGFLVGFTFLFGILYTGHAFPAFRNKENTINYLMLPASVFEKFLMEFIVRILLMLLVLPLLYWITFHLQGYFFTLFTSQPFEPLGLQNLVKADLGADDNQLLIKTMIVSLGMLAFILAFTGAAMFSKQPLIKSLFALGVIVLFYFGYSFFILENLVLASYRPPADMWLVPLDEKRGLQLLCVLLVLTNLFMLVVAYLKIKEKEV